MSWAISHPHVYPLDDFREHETDDVRCWCEPTYDEGLIVHHSLDGREAYETGGAMS